MTSEKQEDIGTPLRLVAGAAAGILSCSLTYPLDLVRSRLSIAGARIGTEGLVTTKGREGTIIGMAVKVIKEEGGVKGLYRGLVPTASGVAPYVAINFASYGM